MDIFKKIVAGFTGYLVLYAEVLREIGSLTVRFFSLRYARLRALPLAEQAFAILTLGVVVFVFLPWRTYSIVFGDEAPRRHAIYSDDFALILLGCFFALVPLLGWILPHEAKNLRRGPLFRYVGLFVVVALAVWNWVSPQRIAPTTEAVFAWSFYLFEVLVFVWLSTGVLGVKHYAQYPVRN